MNKKTTIYDIAKDTNLSIATVSRILNKKGSYSPKSEALVLQAIEKLNYYPSASARSLATNSTRTIGLNLSVTGRVDIDGEYYLQLISGVVLEASRSKYNVLLSSEFDTQISSKFFHQRTMDGIIMIEIESYSDIIRQFIEHRFPVSYVGQQLPFDADDHHIYGGYSEYKREALEYLYDVGARHIAVFEVFNQTQDNLRLLWCREVIEEFRQEKGLSREQCKMVLYDSYDNMQFQLLLQGLLDSVNLPDAIYVDNPRHCHTAYNLIQSKGLRIPEDIAVLSTSHSPTTGEEFSPPLTSIFVNAKEMGRRAVRLLLRQIEEQQGNFDHYVPYRVIERSSTPKRDRT